MTPATIIEKLAPFVSESRKTRIKNVLDYRLASIQLALENPSDINNALAAIRTSEALGIDTVHIINAQGEARSARSVTQGAIYWVNIAWHDSLAAFLKATPHYFLAGAKMDGAITVGEIAIDKPLCLLLGNESRGLTPQAIHACDTTYHIPMCGMSESLNLSVAAAISLYDTSQRKRALIKKPGDLSTQNYLERQANAYIQSVAPRLAQALTGVLPEAR